MSSWREINLYNRHKMANLGACSPIYYKPNPFIKPCNVFYKLLRADKRFRCLKGHTTWHTSMNREGQYYKKYLRYQKRTHPSDFYLYMGEGNRRAIIQFPEWEMLKCRSFLKILWVPPHLAGLGIGTEVMEILKEITMKVDSMAKNNEKYGKKQLSCSCFALSLIPNSFVIEDNYWDIEEIEAGEDRIDWSAEPGREWDNSPDIKMKDETWEYLPKDKIRLNLKELRKFYVDKCGFVECTEMAFHEYWDWERGDMQRDLTITGRSFCHQRWPLMYPPENLSYFEKNGGD